MTDSVVLRRGRRRRPAEFLTDYATTDTDSFCPGPEAAFSGVAYTPVLTHVLLELPTGEVQVCISGDPPRWVFDAIQQLEVLASYQPDWDSAGAPRISEHCIFIVLELLRYVLQPDTPRPSIVPAPHGGLQVEWHTNGFDLEIEIEPSLSVSAYCQRADGSESEAVGPTRDLAQFVPLVERLSRRR